MVKEKRTRNQRQFENLIMKHSAAVGQLEKVLLSKHGNLSKGLIKRIREIGCSVKQLISARNYSSPTSQRFMELFDERKKYYGIVERAVQAKEIGIVRQFSLWLIQIDEKLLELF